jgi:hypothetical protein
MRHIFFPILLACLLFSFSSFAQSIQDESFVQNAIHQFQCFNQFPVEKVYLQTDKPYYSAGENIWYAAYLVDGMTLQPITASLYVYVELINQSDSVCYRYKIRKDSLGFNGNMSLPSELPAGDYHLRAYTWWMQNEGPAYFFQKNLTIGNTIDNEIETTVHYESGGDHLLMADVGFVSKSGVSFNRVKINYQLYKGQKKIRSRTLTLDATGHLHFGFEEDTIGNESYHILLTFDDSRYDYHHVLYVPQENHTFDLQFFPEGGNWLNNGFRTLAFKAVGQNGLSVNVSGTIFNQKGDSIISFASAHKGIGAVTFYIFDSIPTRYYAIAHLQGSPITKRVDLPSVLQQGVGLSMSLLYQQWHYQIITADAGTMPKRFYLLAQSRGKLLFIDPITDSLHLTGVIPEDKLPEGITQFLLLNEQGNPLSERLVFVKHPVHSTVTITSDKKQYLPREKVQLTFALKDAYDSLMQADASVTVTDNRTVKLDSAADNIYTNLLLTSDLKGYIEDPAYYFLSDSPERNQQLDFLILTQGWTRFNVPDILKGNIPSHPFYIEEGQSLSGRVTNILGKPAEDAQVIALQMKQKIMRRAITDQYGRFVLDGISFPDSTLFLLQARTKHGYATVDLHMDQDTFPRVAFMHPLASATITMPDDYLQSMSQQFYLEGGEKVYHLKEVTVTASLHKSLDDNTLYAGKGNPIQGTDLENRFSPGQTVLDVIQTFPGVTIVGGQIQTRGSHGTPLLIIDDMQYPDMMSDDEANMLSSINVGEVEYINFLHGVDASIYGGLGGHGVIIVRLKSGADFASNPIVSSGLAIVKSLGYLRPAQFYSPVYKTIEEKEDQKPDLRTTIYWNPSLLFGVKKPTTCQFYTADSPGTYTVMLEGITNDGNILHVSIPIKVLPH